MVNHFTNQVRVKFSYKSVDDVTECMERGDFMYTIDIKDAYLGTGTARVSSGILSRRRVPVAHI